MDTSAGTATAATARGDRATPSKADPATGPRVAGVGSGARLGPPSLTAIFALLLSSVGVGGEVQQGPTFRAGVDIVQLDVTVLDRDRKPVRGLTAADFILSEDGEPRPIVSFEPVDLRATHRAGDPLAAIAPDIASNQENAERLVVIVFDDANTGLATGPFRTPSRDPWILKTGRQIARDLVNQLGPGDLAAVVFTYMGRAQNFTSNRSRLLSAIDSFVPQNSASGGAPLGCDYRGAEGNCVLATLRHVAEALPASPPRRKVIVFISQGHRLPLVSFGEDGDLALPSSRRLLETAGLQRMLLAL